MDPGLAQQITQAFTSIESRDPIGKTILDGEQCTAFIPGITAGWELVEKAAEQEGLL
jgi:hypothetical protein